MASCPSNAEVIASLKKCANLDAMCTGCICQDETECTTKLLLLAAERIELIWELAVELKSCLDDSKSCLEDAKAEILKLTELVDWDDE